MDKPERFSNIPTHPYRIPGHEVDERIKSKGIRARDIRHKGLLTSNEVRTISNLTAYSWLREGCWSLKDFNRWLACKGVNESGINIYYESSKKDVDKLE